VSVLYNEKPVTYREGRSVIGPWSVPDAAARVRVTLARPTSLAFELWPQHIKVTIDINVSKDGGNWESNGGFSASGGIVIHDGNEQPLSWIGTPLIRGISRVLQVVLYVTGGPCLTAVTVTAE